MLGHHRLMGRDDVGARLADRVGHRPVGPGTIGADLVLRLLRIELLVEEARLGRPAAATPAPSRAA
jgi:hypothetical protein